MAPTIPLIKNALHPKIALCLFLGLIFTLFTSNAKSEELQPANKLSDNSPLFSSLLDKSHSFILKRVNEPAVWFDLFFGDPRTEDEELPSTFVRLRTSVRFIEGEGVKFPLRLRANLKLPRVSRKLRLIITGENEDYIETANSEETTTTGEEEGNRQNTVGLRYTLYHTIRANLHFGAGVNDLDPFDYYFRVIFRRLLHIGERDVVRFSQTGFWNSIDNFGETSRIDLERKMSEITTGRISLHGTYSEEKAENGLEWGVESSLFRKLSAKTALSLSLGAYGETRPVTEITNARITQRLRKNILRPWLFSEIEAEVTFPLTEDDGRDAIGSLAIIFEIQFAS